MNYNSWIFWALFASVIAFYWSMSHRKQNVLLLIASYLFYGFWDYRFLFLIFISTIIDFIGGLGVAGIRLSSRRLLSLALWIVSSSVVLCTPLDYRHLFMALSTGELELALAQVPTRWRDYQVPLLVTGLTLAYGMALPWLYGLPEQTRRKTFLTISMVANLAILGFFKYCDFFIANFKELLEFLGWSVSWNVLGILLPAGISFYTFQAMSYTIDIYRGETEPTEHLGDFALFVCFFPHLVAGPIMRAHTLLPQVTQPRTLAPNAFEEGLFLVLIGLFKKLVLADNAGLLAKSIFIRAELGQGVIAGSPANGAEVLLGLYAFALQIYGDFSGYSAIARGISKWLGFELVMNFDQPYLAVSPSDFWRRWHMSLSTWLRDYLYIPLGGNRYGPWSTYRNLMLTMLLGGLWHGAAWTFVLWGLYQGLLLCFFRVLGEVFGTSSEPSKHPAAKRRPLVSWLAWLACVLMMFHFTCLGWLFFRASSLTAVGSLLTALFSFPEWRATWIVVIGLLVLAFYALPLLLWEGMFNGERRLGALPGGWMHRALVLAYLLVMLVIFSAEESGEFIYFQF